MASRDDVANIVAQLLDALPENPDLPELQVFYRGFIYNVGMYILAQFPKSALGPGDPVRGVQPAGGPGKGYQPAGGPGKGYQPGAFATLVLGLPWDL